MASIRERVRGDVTTYTVQFRHEGKQRGPTFATRAKAEQLVALIEAGGTARAVQEIERQNATRERAKVKPTVAQMLAKHTATVTGITKGTRDTYEMMSRQFAATPLGGLPIDLVQREDVEAWVLAQEESGASSKTIKNKQTFLSTAFKRLVRSGQITINPAEAIAISRTERREMTFLTPTEFWLLLERVSVHFRPFVAFLYGTGMRFGEAIALRVQDLNLDHNPPTATVNRAWKKGGGYGPPKTSRGRRTISLPTYAVEAARVASEGKGPSELVFTNMVGEQINRHTMYGNWLTWIDDKRAEKRGEPLLGKRPRLHDIRHSHASWMLSQGYDLHSLARRLGHESIQTTADIYGHLLPEAQIQAVRAANLALAPAPEPVAIEAAPCRHDDAAGKPFCPDCGTRL